MLNRLCCGYSHTVIAFCIMIDAQPELMSWSLDLDDNMIVLTFTTPVLNPVNNGQLMDCSAVLVGPVGGDMSMAHRLSNSTVGMQIDESMACCDLGEESRRILESVPGFGMGFATGSNDTYLYYDSAGATGTGGFLTDNSSIIFSDLTGVPAISVMLDTTPPAVVQFLTLDLDEGALRFNFSQPVNTSTLDLIDLSLQNLPIFISGSSESVPLTGGSCYIGCNIGRVVTLNLAPSDLDDLKLQSTVCTMVSNCYPHHTSAFAEDFGGNLITAYSFGTNYILSAIIPDTTSPSVDDCTLNLSSDQLVVDFDEPVDVTSFSPSSVTLYNTSGGGDNISLTIASVIRGPSSRNIAIDLGSDADNIKLTSFATAGSTIVLSLLPSAFNDTSDNSVNSTNSRQCTLITDNSGPNISSFVLDLDSNLLQLTFTEPILVDSLNISAYSLTNGTNVVVVNLGDSVLLDSTGAQASGVQRMVSVAFGSNSLVGIKTNSNIGTAINNTFLEIAVNSSLDLSGNLFSAVGPLPAASIIEDNSPATAVEFSLDMNIGQVVLTFNDVVDATTLRPGEIFIQDAATAAIGTHGLAGSGSRNNSSIIVIILSQGNLITLKYRLLSGIATDVNSTYLTIRAHAIDDLSGTDIIAVTDSNGIMANDYTKDIVPPTLDYFDLDMDTGIIVLMFDEPVIQSSLNFSLFAIQSNRTAITPLSSSETLSDVQEGVFLPLNNLESRKFQYQLPDGVVNRLKNDLSLASNGSTTNLVIMQGGVYDASNNSINTTGPVNVQTYLPDVSRPVLSNFTLDVNQAMLLLSFNESVIGSSFSPNNLIIQNTTSNPISMVVLTGDDSDNVVSPLISYNISLDNLNAIKLELNLGTTTDNTYLSADAGIINDTVNLPSLQVLPIIAYAVIPDTTPPELLSYIVNLNDDTFILTFSEPVNISTLNFSLFTLYNQSVVTTPAFSLDGNVDSTIVNVVVVKLIESIAVSLKSDPYFAILSNETFLGYENGSVLDLSDIPINRSVTLLEATRIIPDSTGPDVRSFDLDLDAGILTLRFAEQVNTSFLNSLVITIQSQSNISDNSRSYTLTGHMPNQTDLTNNVNVVLRPQDLNAIKADPDLAVSNETTYLSLLSGVIMDMFGNQAQPIDNASAIIVSNFTQDTTAPEIVGFELQMDEQQNLILAVSFSETINYSSVDPTSLGLFVGPSDPTPYYLTSGVVATNYSEIIRITIVDSDHAEIRNRYPLGSTVNATFLVANANAAADMVGIYTDEIATTDNLVASNITADLIPPTLLNFTLDLNSDELLLTFDEAVVPSSLNRSVIRIQDATGALNHTLTSANAGGNSNIVIMVNLYMDDLDALKIELALATDVNNTYLYLLGRGVAEDIAGNEAFNTTQPIQAIALIPDQTSPRLLNFDLDLNTDYIILYFSEVVAVSTLDATQISIQNHPSRPTRTITLTGGTPDSSVNSSEVRFDFLTRDIDSLKRFDDIAVDNLTTYLTVTTFAIRDMNNNSNDGIFGVNALQVRQYIPDINPPTLNRFILDLDRGIIRLVFSEVVITSTLNTSGITLLSAAGSNIAYTLTTTVTDINDNSTLWIPLNSADLNEIKRFELCTHDANGSDCFISFPNGTIQDTVNLPVIGYEQTNARMVDDYIADNTSAMLEEFVLFDLRNGVLILSFTETVNASTFNSTGIILQTLFADPLDAYTLTGGNTTSMNGLAITVNLTEDDLDNIKIRPFVCSRRYTCYARLMSNTIRDMADNQVAPVREEYPGFIVTNFILDVDNPNLDTFWLDLNNGVIYLSFNEPVDVSSLKPDEIILQSEADIATAGVVQHRLQGGNTNQTDSDLVLVYLTDDDLNALKAEDKLAVYPNNTYIAFSDELVTDLAHEPRPVVEVTQSSAVEALNVTRDLDPPTVTTFSLDLTEDRLYVTFSEPIQPSTLQNLSYFMLHNRSEEPTINKTLSGGTVLTNQSGVMVIEIQLLQEDVTRLKLNELLGTGINNTFLSIAEGAIEDVQGNAIGNISRIQASLFVADATRPQLLSFSINMDNGQMNMSFDDVMLASTFNPTAIRIQNAEELTNNRAVTLTDNTALLSQDNGYVMTVQISGIDLFQIKSTTGLATNASNTYMTIQAFAIDDVDRVDLLAITDGKALRVATYIPDQSPPELVRFDFDHNLGIVNLTFNDSVNQSTLDLTTIRIQNAEMATNSSTMVNILAVQELTISDAGKTLSLTLTTDDLNLLNSLPLVGTNENNTYITIGRGAITDLAGNVLQVGHPDGSALKVTTFLTDDVPVVLESFTLDLNLGVLLLNFSETVALNTFNATGITLQSARNASNSSITYAYMLSSYASVSIIDHSVVRLTLDAADLNEINAVRGLATERRNTYISVSAYTVQDTSGNNNTVIPRESGLQVTQVIDDETSPQLLNFTFNLNNGTLIFTFSETIDVIYLQSLYITNALSSPSSSYQLNGGTYISDPPSVATVVLLDGDLNNIKADPNLATMLGNTYISFSSQFTEDMFDNSIVPVTNFPASDFINDTTNPVLLEYTLDMDTGMLILNFSETVNVSSLRLKQFVFYNVSEISEFNESVSLFLATAAGNMANYMLSIDREDLARLKVSRNLATQRNNTFLDFENGSVYDMAGNPIIKPDQLLPVSAHFQRDITGPVLEGFNLNFSTNSLVMSFSEPVDMNTFLVQQLQLQSHSNALGAAAIVELSDSMTDNRDGEVITIELGLSDLERLQRQPLLATFRNNTFISFPDYAITDIVGNRIVGIPPSNALQVDMLVPDMLGPQLDNYTLDLNTGVLTLTFEETILGSLLLLDRFTFQGSATSATDSVQLTNGTFPSRDTRVISITLGQNDLDMIKANNLGTSINDTYLSLESGAVRDTSNNPNDPIPSFNALQAGAVTRDRIQPNLESFDFDLNRGVLVLHFSESVNLSTLIVTQLTVYSNDRLVPLTSSDSLNTGMILRDVNLTIRNDDLNEIKRLEICSNNKTCNVSFPARFVQDYASNFIRSRIRNVNNSFVSIFYPDVTPPALLDFAVFDLNEGFAVIEFTETVNVSTFDISRVMLHSFFMGPIQDVSLTNAVLLNENNYSVGFNMSIADQNNIKFHTQLCIGQFSCFIRFSASFVEDMAGNSIGQLTGDSILNSIEYPTAYTSDQTSPQLTNYSFDLNTGILVFTFDEPVRSTTFDEGELIFQDALNATTSFQLSSGRRITRTVELTVEFEVDLMDLLEIKALTSLATEQSNTYITYSSDLIRDTSTEDSNQGNQVRNRTNGIDALMTTSFTRDTTAPLLEEFSILDLNTGTLTVRFDEPVNITTYNSSGFTLQSSPNNATAAESLTLNGGIPEYTDSTLRTIMITLSDDDVRDLKLLRNLGTAPADSYLYITQDAINDVAGIPCNASDPANAMRVASYTPDTTNPRLVYYSLDLDSGVLHFSFDDVMDARSLVISRISFQNVSNNANGSQGYQLMGGNPTTVDGYNITINLTDTDVNTIKAFRYLAISQSTTYLVMRADAITDVAGVEVISFSESSANQVDDYIPDSGRPTLMSFEFDLGNNLIVFTFSEVVDPLTLNAREITLQNVSNRSAESFANYTLTGGMFQSNVPMVRPTLVLDISDGNAIKSLLTLGSTINDTFLVISENAIQDMNGNNIVPISNEDALPARIFGEDNTPPTLLEYVLDLNEGILYLTFSESIQFQTLNFTGFIFSPSQSARFSEEYRLTGGNTSDTAGNVLRLRLSRDDLNQLKAMPELATQRSNTYLRTLSDTFEDTAGLSGDPISSINALVAQNVVPDITSPILEDFEFDLGAGVLTLNFSETVDPSTFSPQSLTVQSSPAFPVASRQLTGGNYSMTVGPTIVLSLDINDLDFFRQEQGFATARGNTYLAMNSTAVNDTSMNPVTLIPTNNARQTSVFFPDNMAPILSGFDLDLNNGILILNFLESVQTRSLDVTGITLQSQRSVMADFLNLTNSQVVSTGVTSQVRIELSADDLNGIKAIPTLAVDNQTAFVTIQNNSVFDVSGNGIEEIAIVNAVPINMYTQDGVSPTLENFEIRLVTEPLQIIITFSETVNYSSIDLMLFSLTDMTSLIPLSGTESMEYSPEITINVSASTLASIRTLNSDIGRYFNTTYLSISDNGVSDMAGNPIIAIVRQVDVHNADLIPPEVMNFTLDLNNGITILTFTENVASILNTTGIIEFSNMSTPVSAPKLISYEAGSVQVFVSTIEVQISIPQLNNIKLCDDIGMSTDDTYITGLTSGLACDMANNCAEGIPPAMTLQASRVINDTTGPRLVSFDLDASTGVITFYFNEPINVTSIDPRQITLQSSRASFPSQSCLLEEVGPLSGVVDCTNGTQCVASFNLTRYHTVILEKPNLATLVSNTFLSASSEAFADVSGNFNQEIRPRLALQVTRFINDNENPSILSASLDLNNENLILVFNEAVMAESLVVSVIQLSDGSGYDLYLVDSIVTSSFTTSEVTIQLSSNDLNNVKRETLCSGASGAADCFISFSSALVNDTSFLSVNARPLSSALPVTVMADTTSPRLVEFKEINLLTDH